MGWKGDPCWYCRADLYAIEEQQEMIGLDLDDRDIMDDPRSFEWHMAGNCMAYGYRVEIRHGGVEYRIKTPDPRWG